VTHRPWNESRQATTIGGMVQRADILVRFGRTVRAMREAADLSQEAFADKCGLDRTYISGIERGKRNLSLRNIEVIATALGLSISEMFRQV
jgi:transcriptional regulator with XRE-family HTH domain